MRDISKVNISAKKRKEIQERRHKLKATSLGYNFDLKTRLKLYKQKKHNLDFWSVLLD